MVPELPTQYIINNETIGNNEPLIRLHRGGNLEETHVLETTVISLPHVMPICANAVFLFIICDCIMSVWEVTEDTYSSSSADSDADQSGSDGQNAGLVPIIEKRATFKTKKQKKSRFMRLPAECRLTILRELLVAEEPLSYRSEYPDQFLPVPKKRKGKKHASVKKNVKQVKGYRLSPQILSVCQKLLIEAWPILYREIPWFWTLT